MSRAAVELMFASDIWLEPAVLALLAEARAQVDELTRGAQRKQDLVEGQDAEHKLTYLKGAMMQYMLTGASDTTQKEALMRVIATILHFSPQETQRIQTKIAEAEAANLA